MTERIDLQRSNLSTKEKLFVLKAGKFCNFFIQHHLKL